MQQDKANRFIAHLQQLAEHNAGAMAALRHSLAFDPGSYPKAFPWVERFVAADSHENDADRLALYAVAGLYALHPRQGTQSLASALGDLMREKKRASLELRFIALLEADADTVVSHLRQATSLLKADARALDYAGLLMDLPTALEARPWPDARDRLKSRWARAFYRALDSHDDDRPPQDVSANQEAD